MNVSLDEDKAASLKVAAGDYVCFCITDAGLGVSEELLSKIFEPFFTTKSEGNGTGLGLSMVYRFVKDSGGTIDVASEVGRGTSFSLYFPRSCNSVPVADDNVSNTDSAVGGSETILVVEDEEEIRFLTSLILRDAGYKVLEAEHGHEGLGVIQNSDENIDLVFTDISMPGDMNGVQMAARIQVLKPQIRLLFTSGYAADAIPDMNLASEYPILHKPYQPQDLLLKIREILEG
jgi:CheY-like chemotaxis protein